MATCDKAEKYIKIYEEYVWALKENSGTDKITTTGIKAFSKIVLVLL